MNKTTEQPLISQDILDEWHTAANTLISPDHADTEEPIVAAAALKATVRVLASRDWPEPIEIPLIAYCDKLVKKVTPYRRINLLAGVYNPDTRAWDETVVSNEDITSWWLQDFQKAQKYGIQGLPAFDDVPTGAQIRIQARPHVGSGRDHLVVAEHLATMTDEEY